MKFRVITGIMLTLFLMGMLTSASNIQPSVTKPSVIAHADISAEQLVWSDEFSGSTIGPNWEHMIGDGTLYGLPHGWGNNELQYYTARPENSYVAGGCLHIVALKEKYEGHDYTSARLRTKNRQDFLYGKMEARMKLPTTKGMWPAFWMMPTDEVYGGWAASGEIDIMEAFVSDFPKQIVGSIHYGGQWPNNEHQSYSYAEDQTDFSKDFHNYTLEWEPTEFRWYVDGNLYGTTSDWWSSGGDYPAPFDQYFHFLVNLAIGGNPVPPPDESTVFPQELVIDYVRVYQISEHHDMAVVSVTPIGIPGFNSSVPGCDVAYARWHPTWTYGFYIEVVVKNKGTFTENDVVVSLYNGSSLIGTTTIASFTAETQLALNFSWTPFQNITSPPLTPMYGYPWPYPTRTDIKANITVVEGDVNITNNEYVFGTLTIRYPGDAGKVAKIAGVWTYTPADGKVYTEDLYLFGKWGWGADRTKTGSPKTKYEALGFWCDFNHDGKVWVEDLQVLGRTWGDSPS